MYKIVKSVIETGNYDLTAITKKIKALWVQSDLTDEEYAELTESARNGAKTEYSIDLITKLEELDKRLTALEKADNTTEETITDFVEGKWYYNGDKCISNGTVYTCIAPEGVVCVWSPEAYPTYWTEVV